MVAADRSDQSFLVGLGQGLILLLEALFFLVQLGQVAGCVVSDATGRQPVLVQLAFAAESGLGQLRGLDYPCRACRSALQI